MELSKNFTLAELCKSQTATRHNIINIPTDKNIINNLDLANWCSVHLNYDQIILEFYNEGEPTSGWVHISFSLENNRKKYLSFNGKQYKEMT